MGCSQSTNAHDEHTDRNVHVSNNRRLVFGLTFGKGDLGGVEVKLHSGYESGFKRVYDDTSGTTIEPKNDEQTTQLE